MSTSMREALLTGLMALAIALGLSLSPRPGMAEEICTHAFSGLGDPIYLNSMTDTDGGTNVTW